MNVEHFTSMLTTVIRSIPADDESHASVVQLCRQAGFNETEAATVGPTLVALLTGFGVLHKRNADIDQLVKASGSTAALFLHSYAQHLSDDKPLLENWSRPGTVEPPYSERDVVTGPQFLYCAERRRAAANVNALALRQAEISQIVVSRQIKGREKQYLMLHDRAARQFQLPGGHRRVDDTDPRHTAIREMQEELPGFVFDPNKDQLVELGKATVKEVSRTYGVLTDYQMTFFHLQTTRERLGTDPHARWVDVSTLLSADAVIEGQTLNLVGLHKLNAATPVGVSALTSSIKHSRRGWLRSTAKAKPLEFWGFIVGLAGLISSVIFFLLQ